MSEADAQLDVQVQCSKCGDWCEMSGTRGLIYHLLHEHPDDPMSRKIDEMLLDRMLDTPLDRAPCGGIDCERRHYVGLKGVEHYEP